MRLARSPVAPNSTKTVGASWAFDVEEEDEEEDEEGTAGSRQLKVVGSSMPRRCLGARLPVPSSQLGLPSQTLTESARGRQRPAGTNLRPPRRPAAGVRPPPAAAYAPDGPGAVHGASWAEATWPGCADSRGRAAPRPGTVPD